MNSAALATVWAIAAFCGLAFGHPVRYDQRQEGDLNVRTDVEDIVFVVVPPHDLVTAGMGLLAATASDLLRKTHGGIGPERLAARFPPKGGFLAADKSPFLGQKVKKISHAGDPNRYNIVDGVNPPKLTAETKLPAASETSEKTAEEMPAESQKTEEIKTTPAVNKKDILEEKNKEKVISDSEKKSQEAVQRKPVQKEAEEPPKLLGEGTKGGLDPSSILRLEGCGPDAYRDSTGKCVLKS